MLRGAAWAVETMTNPAESYEQFMVPALFGPWARKLVELASVCGGERVLDVGCGTGIVARTAAPFVGATGKVTGIDANPNMLAVARTASDHEGLRIEWLEGRAERLPFADASFDVVLSQFALMFFDDRAFAVAEMRRVVRANGRALTVVWQGLDEHPFYRTLDRVLDRRFGMSGVRQIFAMGDAEALLVLGRAAGFGRARVDPVSITARFPNPSAFLAGEIDVDTAAIPSMQHLDDDARATVVTAIASEMQTALDDVTVGDEVVLPFRAHIAFFQP
jgi:ubiquinone/menaquinone biosynthesis C-methylase UbiE